MSMSTKKEIYRYEVAIEVIEMQNNKLDELKRKNLCDIERLEQAIRELKSSNN